jgi:transmembrane sensor
MNDGADIVVNEAALEAAIGWYERVSPQSATAEDWASLTLWLEASPANLTAFENVESVTTDIREMAPDLLALINRPSAQILSFPPRRPKPAASQKRQRAVIAAAAGFVLAIGVGVGTWRLSQGAIEVYHTAPGEMRSITLADGSRIQLDAATTLSARLGWFSRQLRMGEGEASFDVAKNAKRPFIVTVGDQRVRVVGTEFNIGDYDGTLDVTVRRGTVDVYQTGNTPVGRLTPGWKLEHRVGADASVIRQVDPDIDFAWIGGRLICKDEPLPRIAAYLNRRYGTPLRLSPAAAAKRFSGVLELGDQGNVLRHIASYLSLTVHRSDQEIILD